MSVRAQRVLLLEAFSSKEDPDRTASEHDTGPLPPFVKPLPTPLSALEKPTPTPRRSTSPSFSESREWGCGLRVCGELFFVKWNWIRFAAFPMCPRALGRYHPHASHASHSIIGRRSRWRRPATEPRGFKHQHQPPCLARSLSLYISINPTNKRQKRATKRSSKPAARRTPRRTPRRTRRCGVIIA
jgi:hypothetical protein